MAYFCPKIIVNNQILRMLFKKLDKNIYICLTLLIIFCNITLLKF